MASPKSERMVGLDGLRGMAMLMVLVHHLNVYAEGGPVSAALHHGFEILAHGVDLFFILSGFLIWRGLERSQGRPGWLSRFWVHRFAKLVPVYLACVAGVYLVLPPLMSQMGLQGHAERFSGMVSAWPWYVGFASNFWNALCGRFTNPALDVCWSLGIEVQFYVLVTTLFLFGPEVRRKAVWAFIFIALLSRCAMVASGMNWIQVLVLPWGRLDSFAMGALVAMGINMRGSRLMRGTGWLVLGCVLFFPWTRESAWVQCLGYTAIAIPLGLLAEHLAFTEGGRVSAFFSHPALVLCGRASYCIYLIHLPLRAVLRDILLPAERVLATPRDWLFQFGYIALCGLVCLGAGCFVWRFIEEPLRVRLVRWMGGA